MQTEISDRALINAVTSINNDIKRHEALAAEDDVTEEELGDLGEAILEMKRAFGELAMIYKERAAKNHALPTLESLVGEEV